MRICGSALLYRSSASGNGDKAIVRLWLVTRGAQPTGQPPRRRFSVILQAPLWGLGRVISLEHPHLRCSLIDLDPDDAAAESNRPRRRRFSRIRRRIRFRFRGGERYAARLVRSAPPARATRPKLERPEHRPFQLQISTRGVMDNLSLRPGAPPPPNPARSRFVCWPRDSIFATCWLHWACIRAIPQF